MVIGLERPEKCSEMRLVESKNILADKFLANLSVLGSILNQFSQVLNYAERASSLVAKVQ